MIEPLRQWTCDVCGNVIKSAKDGYVIWRKDDSGRDHDFKIVHQMTCDLDDYPSSMPVEAFLDADGLSYLLSFLSVGPLRLMLGDVSGPGVANLDEFVDFIRRLQIPYYEVARRRLSDPEILERLADSNEASTYMSDVLKNIASGYYKTQ